MSSPEAFPIAGADAAAAPAPSPWRPVLVRLVFGCIALLGLSGIGAVSMLAGLDGAHASPPGASSVGVPGASASIATATQPAPSAGTLSAGASTGTAESPMVPSPGSLTAACPTRTADGRVILNQASLEDLRKIPGIGPKRAEAILALRAKIKRFKRGTDLLRVRGIGAKSLTRMQSHFVVDPPAGSECTTNQSAAK